MIYQISYKKMNGSQRKVAGLVKDRESLMALRNSQQNLDNLARARQGDEQAKRNLLQLAYNLGHVEGEIAGCKSIGSFFFHDVDCYGPSPVLEGSSDAGRRAGAGEACGREGERKSPLNSEEVKELILSKKDEIGLVMLERSASGGWHLVCRRVPGTTILENQVRVATILQLEMDTSAKDLQRVVFSTSGSPEDLVYLDDVLFTEPMTPEECVQEFNRLKVRVMRKQEQVPEAAKKANKHWTPSSLPLKGEGGHSQEEKDPSKSPRQGRLAGAETPNGNPADARSEHTTLPLQGGKATGRRALLGNAGRGSFSFKGIPYSSIIQTWWKQNGGEPVEGERNVKLYQLAVNLRAICDNSPALLMKVLPRLGLDEEELRSIVDSACKEQVKGISKALQEILATLSQADASSVQTAPSLKSPSPTGEGLGVRLNSWGSDLALLFPQFPVLADVCKGLKTSQYPAAVFVAGGLMMTLMTRCTYRFYHRPDELRRLNNSTFIVGDPASGKSFATRLYKLLTAPIAEADKVGREAINAYRELMKTKGANKEKPTKPKVVVRIHPARTSNAQFIQDMVNAVEEVDGQEMQLHMLTFDTELDNTVTVQKGGSWIDKQSMELKAFHNEEDGQAYSNVDSILQDFIVTWNFIYTGTPIALKKKVNEQNFGSGLATRLTCIPLPATNFEMMAREQTVDYDSDNRLKEWAVKLDRMKGELSVQKIVDELYDWTARRMEDAKENDSKADEMLLKRCAYHGLNFAAPFIVMRHWSSMKQDGTYWCGTFETDDIDWQLARLIVNIQYACQRYYFGAMAEAYFDNKLKDASVNVQRRQKTIEGFARLPEQFDTDDVMRCFNLSSEGAARMKIKRLLSDRLIEKTGDGRQTGASKSSYRKTGNIML